MDDLLRYRVLRPMKFRGEPFTPGQYLPDDVAVMLARPLLHTGMVEKALPEGDAGKLAGTLLRARRSQKEHERGTTEE